MSAHPLLTKGGPSNQAINEVVSGTGAARHAVGTRAFLPDGRVFYYTENTSSAALTRGELQVMPEITANHQNLATATTSGVIGASVFTDVTLGATAAAANLYAEGYLAIVEATATPGTGGTLYKIKSHDAIASAGTGDFQLYDTIVTATVAGDTVSLIPNPYKSPQQSNVDQIDIPVGVAPVTIPAGDTTPQWGWLQTWGPCAVLFDEAIATVGQAVTIGSSTVGAVEEDDTATTVSQEFIVGYNISIGVDAEFQVVDLRIRP